MFTKFKTQEIWQRNLIVLWFGTFMTGIGSSLVAPFISLYIATLGNYSHTELNIWSGLVFSSTFIVLAIVSPLWGRLADQKGRKLMLLRASIGMSIIIFLMGFVTATWQLLILRMLMGGFSGFISNSIALMASATPKEKSGAVLSRLTTGSVAETLIGPVVGGFIVNLVGYRFVFVITGTIMLLVFFLTVFFVKEDFKPALTTSMGLKAVFKEIPQPTIVWGMLLTTLITQMTNLSINPILSLYVRELMGHDANHITTMAGIVAAAPGIVTLLLAPRLGRLGDKIGQKKVLGAGLILSLIIFLLTFTVTSVYLLIIMRLLVGISDSAILPSVQAILAKQIPREITGRVFSYNQSAQAIGAFTGPLIGASIAAFIDYRFIFVGSALLVVINLINFKTHTKQL